MGSLRTIVAVVVSATCAGAAAARQSLPLYTCIEVKGGAKITSDASVCRSARPVENAASSPAERAQANRQAWLKRYPTEAAYEAARQVALEESRARTVPERQQSEAARINRGFDAQRERLRPLWNPPPP